MANRVTGGQSMRANGNRLAKALTSAKRSVRSVKIALKEVALKLKEVRLVAKVVKVMRWIRWHMLNTKNG